MAQDTLLDILAGGTMSEGPSVDAEWHRRRPRIHIPESVQKRDRPEEPYDPESLGTIYSITVQDNPSDQGSPWVLIPSIVGGEVVTQNDAIRHYKKTGEHLGKFQTSQEADAYAGALSNAIGRGIFAGPPRPR